MTVFNDQRQKRTIIGGAYWFPHQGTVSTAILIDYDRQSFDNITTAPTEGRRLSRAPDFLAEV